MLAQEACTAPLELLEDELLEELLEEELLLDEELLDEELEDELLEPGSDTGAPPQLAIKTVSNTGVSIRLLQRLARGSVPTALPRLRIRLFMSLHLGSLLSFNGGAILLKEFSRQAFFPHGYTGAILNNLKQRFPRFERLAQAWRGQRINESA